MAKDFMTQIDRDSPVPLYSQLKAILLRKLESEWQAGQLIPGESALEETYGLSRITVRQALSELVNDGYLYRQRGRGTFVRQPKFTHDPAQRLALTDTMRQHGVTPGWRVLDSGTCEATPDLSERLGIAEGSPIFILKRLRLADEEAIGYHLAYVPGAQAEYVDEDAFERDGSLHYLRNAPDLSAAKAHRTLEARGATETAAKHLSIAEGDPVLHIERLTANRGGKPIELLSATYRGDRFSYYISL